MGYYRAGKFWNDETLWSVAKKHKPVKMKVTSLIAGKELQFNMATLVDMAQEIELVHKCNLSYPIIIGEDWIIMDGCHRLLKAYLLGKEYIKTIILKEEELPKPDYDEYEAVLKSKNK